MEYINILGHDVRTPDWEAGETIHISKGSDDITVLVIYEIKNGTLTYPVFVDRYNCTQDQFITEFKKHFNK